MYILQSYDNLRCIQPDIFLGKCHLLIEMFCQVFSLAVLQTKVNVVWGLEGEVQTNDEWVVYLFEDVYFGDHKFCLLA